MPNVRKILPKKEREVGTGRALKPFGYQWDEFFEHRFPRRWMESFFEPFMWKRPYWGEFEESFDFYPKIDLFDKGEALVVRAEMPGIKKEDLDITLSGDRLIFEAKRDFEEEVKEDDFFRHEMAYGRLFRSIRLPVEVMFDDIKAELHDGILEVFMPKVEVTTPYKVKVA